jgi:hypothetical protein
LLDSSYLASLPNNPADVNIVAGALPEGNYVTEQLASKVTLVALASLAASGYSRSLASSD